MIVSMNRNKNQIIILQTYNLLIRKKKALFLEGLKILFGCI